MRSAIGTRPAADLTVRFIEATSQGELIRMVDSTDVDLLVLDGEAQPAGGLAFPQLKDEFDDCPPTIVVIARAVDRWLAAYASVDATLTHPLDPMTTGQTVATMLRDRAAACPRSARRSAFPGPFRFKTEAVVVERTWPNLLTALVRGEELATPDTAGPCVRSWPAMPPTPRSRPSR